MNGKDIFLGLGYIDRKFIEEAELAEYPKSKIHTLKRPLLIAAIVALMLMLAGCAAVAVLRMRDMKVGVFPVKEPVFNADHSEYLGTTEVPYTVLSVNGFQETPAFQASMEWYAFTQSYDPDFEIFYSVRKNLPKFPEKYDAYEIYTQEMADKVDEICRKYKLKSAGKGVVPKNPKATRQVLGVDSFLHSEAMAGMAFRYTKIYESGNFYSTFDMLMDEGGGRWPYPMTAKMYYLKKDCFNPSYVYAGNLENWAEMDYTTASGYNVRLLYSENNGSAWILYDREDAVITVDIYAAHVMPHDMDEEPVAEFISLEQMKQVADAFNFGIQPDINIGLAKTP